jgi:hypothetical protein
MFTVLRCRYLQRLLFEVWVLSGRCCLFAQLDNAQPYLVQHCSSVFHHSNGAFIDCFDVFHLQLSILGQMAKDSENMFFRCTYILGEFFGEGLHCCNSFIDQLLKKGLHLQICGGFIIRA